MFYFVALFKKLSPNHQHLESGDDGSIEKASEQELQVVQKAYDENKGKVEDIIVRFVLSS